jgi:S-formylglutathione hydrolase FrmB
LRTALVTALALAAALTGCSSGRPHAVPTPAGRKPTASRRRATAPPLPAAKGAGTVREVLIPGTVSGFHARPALVYLPPAAATGARLPVLEVLHGTPGGPRDWMTHGRIPAIMNAFAASHGGRAPIVVSPDINGALWADSECVHSPRGGDVETYLTVDVPNWLLAHTPASPNHHEWAIAGLSEGGTCAMMLALRHYPDFRAFGDISGLARPTVGDRDAPQRTITKLFGGSRTAYDEHDPLWLLPRHHYPGLAGWFACGSSDAAVLADQKTIAPIARAAGLTVHDEVVPGRHTWLVWSGELQQMLPWLWELIA